MFKKNSVFLFLLLFIGSQLSWCQIIIKAEGNQFYCPLTQLPVATSFSVTHPTDTGISELFIQISTGYVINQDQLRLTGAHPNVETSWNNAQGKLTLSGIGGARLSFADLTNAVLAVIFESNLTDISGSRSFSFTIGDANYLPSTGNYYEFVDSVGITWKEALKAAAQRSYYGRPGYLATICSPEESQLAGEQASGAGWIGGTDEEVEGIWKWATGPEAGTVFWNGGVDGYAPSGQYSNWNTSEPNNLGDEDYAHITAPGVGIKGSWNDLTNAGGVTGNYQPKGYIVEYGVPGDAEIDASAFTTISIKTLESTEAAARCGSGSVTLKATGPSGAVVLWYAALTGGTHLASGPEFATPSLLTTTTYYALSSYNGCTNGVRTAVVATIKPLPIILANITYKNCDVDGVADGFSDFNLNEIDVLLNPTNTSGLTITYHLTFANANSNADDGIDPLNPSLFNNATSSIIYARVRSANGCHVVSTINLQVSTTYFEPNYLQELKFCDDDGINDGIYNFDLTDSALEFKSKFPSGQNLSVHYYKSLLDAQLNQNEIQNTSNYRNTDSPFSQLIYVRVQSDDNNDCFGAGPHLQLTVNPLPEFTVDQSEGYCINGGSIVLEALSSHKTYTYIWTDPMNQIISRQPTANVAASGTYTVIAKSSDGCQSVPVNYIVKESEIANLTDANISIDDFSDTNSITIDTNNLGVGNYEFSLGSMYGPYQDALVFNDVAAGVYTLYARDKNECGIAELDIYVMGFPKYFTPNNDTHNDFWNLKGFEGQFLKQSYIDIYDRYGLFLARIKLNELGWDGQYKGRPLPATDYWFVAHFLDNVGQVRNFKGHFSLIR